MAEETQSDRSAVAGAAAATVAADTTTAELLAKYAAGEKLSPQQYGKVGAWKAKLKAVFTGKGGAPGPGAGPAQPGAAPGNALGVGTMAPAEAPGNGLPVVPPDPRVVQRTTESIIKALDGIARRKIVTEARKTANDRGLAPEQVDRTAARFDSAASVPVAAKDMMVETSPDVAAALGIDPKSYPIATFLGGLGLWSTNLWLCMDELKAMRPAQPKPEPAAAPANHTIPPSRPASPFPAMPPGTPAEATAAK
jgi:hypothetical protein